MPEIALERVVFREPVYVPSGRAPESDEHPAVYASKETVIGCWPKPTTMMSRQHYLIWLDRDFGEITLEHPESHERETYPISNVLQYRVKRAVKVAAAPKPAKGKAAA